MSPARLAALGPGRYNPVNVLWVDEDRALVAHVDDSGPVRVVELAPGPHVLTTRDVDDAKNPKVAMLSAGMERVLADGDGSDEVIAGLRAMLADHTSASDSPVRRRVHPWRCVRHGFGVDSRRREASDSCTSTRPAAPASPPFAAVPIPS